MHRNNLYNKALALHQGGMPAEAIPLYRRLLDATPDDMDLLYRLGTACAAAGLQREAGEVFRRFVALSPHHAEGRIMLGSLLHAVGDGAGAADQFRAALDLRPESMETAYNLGVILFQEGEYRQAELALRHAVALRPDFPEAEHNLCVAVQEQGRLEEALGLCTDLVRKYPDSATARFNLACLQLLFGDLPNGLAGYEARFASIDPVSSRFCEIPRWDGTNLSGRTILIHTEQGFGDAFQAARYLPLLAAGGARVVVEAPLPTRSLLARVKGVAATVARGEEPPPVDCSCPIMSLPFLFGTTLDSIPDEVPYISPDPTLAASWGQKIERTGLMVGIAWSGRLDLPVNRKRRCPPTLLRPLADIPGVTLVSLQVGGEREGREAGLPLQDSTQGLKEFHDTAALLANLDLVISIDTSVAHLAGAMGVECWTLLPCVPDWRWLLGRSDSPWYPSMRLFRQERPGDWEGVIKRVADALGLRVNKAGIPPLDEILQEGNRLHCGGAYAEALDLYNRATGWYPASGELFHNRANSLLELGRHEEAVAGYERAIHLLPGCAEPYTTKATSLLALGRSKEAEEACRAALAIDPGFPEAHWNLALALLLHGDYPQGWLEYEWRWLKRDFTTPVRHRSHPRWNGEGLEGGRLLVHAEQGFGDTIQFVRYLPLVASRGCKVLFECHRELVRLMESIEGVEKVIPFGEGLPEFAAHSPLMSLPMHFSTTLETVPAPCSYLAVPPRLLAAWRERIPDGDPIRVGLAWAGRPKPDPNRSCPAPLLAPLAKVAGVSYLSLQVGISPSCPQPDIGLIDLTDQIEDFADTAALIANLDLVISIDTSVAHLAGALGKPVWLLLPYAPDWRWLLDREDSPWYPTMRIFRQELPGDWSAPLAKLAAELSAFAAGELNRRGMELAAADNPDRALVLFGKAAEASPCSVEARYNMGNVLLQQGDPDGAVSSYLAAIALAPHAAELWHNLGHAWKRAGHRTEALHALRKAASMAPSSARFCYSLGEILAELEDDEGAAFWFEKGVEASPGDPVLCNALGHALQMLGRLDEARECYERAIALAPGHLDSLNNLGVLWRLTGDLERSRECLHAVLQRDEGHADAHWNLAVTLLLGGEMQQGWREYEWRFRTSSPVTISPCPWSRWQGEELRGKRVLLVTEQGFGDTFQFVRFASVLAQQGATLYVACHSGAMREIIRTAAGVSGVIVPGEELPECDLWTPLLSIPYLLGITLDTIPSFQPYLSADPGLVKRLRNRLPDSGGVLVGLVWAGRKRPDPNRSIPPRALASLGECRGVTFVSLQVEPAPEHLAELSGSLGLLDPTADIADFSDTAAIIASLDLVLTIDTACAHLAGAMGKAVWVMLPFAPDWRWLLGREDSPWYPGMQLFRQEQPGEWGIVIDRIRSCLQELSDSRTAATAQLSTVESAFARGDALREEEAWDRALSCYESALTLEPGNVRALVCAGGCLLFLKRHREAADRLREAIRIDPGQVDAHWNISVALLSMGIWEEGWREFEWRRHYIAEPLPPFPFLERLPAGAGLEGKTLLLHTEQGYGDTFQFLRYVPLLAARGARVILTAPAGVIPVAVSVKGLAEAIPHGKLLPRPDFQALLMSLPYLLGTGAPVPAPAPYLSPPPERLAWWRERTGDNSRLKVGLVWGGREMGKSGYRRSIPLDTLAGILKLQNIRFFSLQTGERSGEPEAAGLDCLINDLSGELTDFGETAAAIASLDLVITVDTASAHLAGALGVPVWVMLLHAPDWRWFPEQETTPWYPSMRLFRQSSPGDWEGVVEAVGSELGSLATRRLRERLTAAIVGNDLPLAERLIEQAGEDAPEHLFHRGTIALKREEPRLAEEALRRLLELEPEAADAWNNLGVALERQERGQEALEAFRQAVAHDPDYPEAWLNLGRGLHARLNYDQAMASLERAVSLNPDYAEAWQNLGVTRQAKGMMDGAFAAFSRALALRPDYHTARWNLSLLELLTGDYRQGFADFEARFLKTAPVERRHREIPQWEGDDPTGRTILIHAEQGYGDTLQFARYIPLVAARGAGIVVEVQAEPLRSVMATLPGVGLVVVRGERLPAVDLQAPLLSLPRIFGTTMATTPPPCCIEPPAGRVLEWRRRLAGDTGLKAGIIWAGRRLPDPWRSIPHSCLAPLAAIPGVAWHSLQVDAEGEDTAARGPFAPMDHRHELADFAETAALMANLDLVISIDTAGAHLAGALSRPTWLLLPFAPDWRWGLGCESTPWYPSMRLFRQRTPGEWGYVVSRVCLALDDLLTGRKDPPHD